MTQLRSGKVIGSIVLVSLLVILIPDLFKQLPPKQQSLAIPNLPASPDSVQFNLGLSTTYHALENPFKLPTTPAQAWALQLADFNKTLEANTLVHSLRQKGYKAYARQVKTPQGWVTRVFVGPEIKREQIKRVAEQLNKDMQINPIVTSFDPLLLPSHA